MSKRHRRIRTTLPGDSTAVLKRQLPTLQAMVRQAKQCPPPCLLCGQSVGAGAIRAFTPQDTAAWGIPRGYLASRVYTLCPSCEALENVQTHVLAVFWRERTAYRWN